MQRDTSVANRLFMTRRGHIVEATGLVKVEANDHYVEAKDQETGAIQMYAKRNLRPHGYVRKQHALGALATLL